jgi:HK97 family phage prohead protease
MLELEYKRFPLNVKALEKRQFEGYLSTFGNVDHGGDIVVRGAFKKTLSEWKARDELPPMFWMHQADRVPGKWLAMSEDDDGLYVKGELAETELGNEMHTLLGMKAVRGMSIGYVVEERDYSKEGHRLLKEIDLWEGSIVSMGMNPLAKVEAVKSRLSKSGEFVPQPADFKRSLEQHLRDVGCSWSVAKQLVSKMFEGTASVTDDEDLLREGDDELDDDDEMKAVLESLRLKDELVIAASLETVLKR